jgi:hypothetical protein
MNYNIATILAVIAIIFVLITYITASPLVPVAVILLGLAIIFGGRGSGSLRNSWALPLASDWIAERLRVEVMQARFVELLANVFLISPG